KCSFLYGGAYLSAKLPIVYYFAKEQRMENFTKQHPKAATIITGLILGAIFILDAIISGYLKTPLARIANRVEICQFSSDEAENEKYKKYFLSSTQEANELFKKTFEKFGILAVPSLLIS